MLRCDMLRFVVKCVDLEYAAWMKDDDIVKGARQVTAFLTGPGGDLVSLDAAVAKHLGWFVAARDRGIRWRGIAALLTQAGARRPDGGALTAAQLSAVYSRQNLKRATARKPSPSVSGAPSRPTLQDAPLLHRVPTTADVAAAAHGAAAAIGDAMASPIAPHSDVDPRRDGQSSGEKARNIDEIRERMRRASMARNPARD